MLHILKRLLVYLTEYLKKDYITEVWDWQCPFAKQSGGEEKSVEEKVLLFSGIYADIYLGL